MYTLVLMTAMTSAPEAPQFNGYFQCLFSGCCGSSQPASYSGNTVPYYSCYGGCSGSTYSAPGGCCSCTGYLTSCSGCNGCTGCNGDTAWQRVRRWFEGLGCCGGCCGGCHGCCGGYGSGYGCNGASPYGYFGTGVPAYPYPAYPGMGGVPSYPTPAIPTIPYANPETAPALSPQNTGLRPANYGPGFSAVSNGNPGARAVVLIKLPADARLYADNKALALQGGERQFVTPELPGGQDYVYRFRVEYDRNGETLSVTRRIAVRAGAMISVEFADMTAPRTAPEKNAGGGNTSPSVATTSVPNANTVANTTPTVTPSTSPGITAPGVTTGLTTANTNPTPTTAAAMGRATIKVTLPPGATLYIDDQKSLSADPVRQFSTPPLPAGKEYVYMMKAELIRNGRAETVTQKVPFHAGERVEVDFTAGLR